MVNRITDGLAEGYMLESRVSELFTKLNEKLGYNAVNQRLEAIKNSRIKVTGADYDLMKVAEQIKSTQKGRLPMTAAYMIALAKKLGAVLVTSDESP